MTENLQADCVQSRQAGFIQCFLKAIPHKARLTLFSISSRHADTLPKKLTMYLMHKLFAVLPLAIFR